MTTFELGDPVQRKGSDYKFPGVVVAVFRKKSGEIRYVVEDDRGTLFVQSDKSLEPRVPGEEHEQEETLEQMWARVEREKK